MLFKYEILWNRFLKVVTVDNSMKYLQFTVVLYSVFN